MSSFGDFWRCDNVNGKEGGAAVELAPHGLDVRPRPLTCK